MLYTFLHPMANLCCLFLVRWVCSGMFVPLYDLRTELINLRFLIVIKWRELCQNWWKNDYFLLNVTENAIISIACLVLNSMAELKMANLYDLQYYIMFFISYLYVFHNSTNSPLFALLFLFNLLIEISNLFKQRTTVLY